MRIRKRGKKQGPFSRGLHAPLYYVPGNHDVHSSDVERYRNVFGKDYYSFRVKDVTFVVIDSQLLGNYDVYDAKQPAPLPAQTEEKSERMLQWLATVGDKGEAKKVQKTARKTAKEIR